MLASPLAFSPRPSLPLFFLSPFPFSLPGLTKTKKKKTQDVSIPIDNATGSHRGFGFVEFEEEADAAAAALNMDAAEFFGRTLRVNQSQSRVGGGANRREAVWADGDAWNERAGADGDAMDASAAFKRQEVGGGGAAAAREQPATAAGAPSDPMAAAEAALG